MIFPPIGKEYWSTENGQRYEVSKISPTYVYLARFDGSCSHVCYISKDKWATQTEFVNTSSEAWHTLLTSDVKNAEAELRSKQRLLDSYNKENGVFK